MKIIEALKQIKDLTRKADDLRDKVRSHCADMDYEAPLYPDQKAQVSQWLQAHRDVVKNIGDLKFSIQKTNINTFVTINLDGADITKTITEWISRRKELALKEREVWSSLWDKNLKDLRLQQSAGQIIDAKVRRYYDPIERDRRMSSLASEPSIIDGKLEIVNAITDLLT